MRTIETLGDLRSKRILIRSDFNVPLKDGKIAGDGRIRAALPTLTRLVEAGTRVVVMTYLGHSEGKVDPAFSLTPVAKRLSELIDVPVTLAKDVVGKSAKTTVETLKDGGVTLLENMHYDARETSKVNEGRGELTATYAEFGGTFVSDGFGIARREQTSVYNIAKLLPFASDLPILKEIESLHKATDDPERLYGVVLGGSKISDKLGVIAGLLKRAGRLFIGSGMVFTFLTTQGHSVGRSLLGEEQIDTVKGYIAEAAERGVELILPIGVVVAPELVADASASVVTVDQILADQMSLNIGPESRKLFAEKISSAKAVAWNDPMGVFEFPTFAEGMKAVAEALSEGDVFSVTGGRDSATTVRLLDFDESTLSHISTGSDASLELLKGKVLPGIAVLEDWSMAHTPLMAGNWRMNLDHLEADHLIQGLTMELKGHNHDYAQCEVLVIPPFTNIRTAQTIVDANELGIRYGAQDVSIHNNGAYTGKISIAVLDKLDYTYVVMGHSECREYRNGSDELAGQKVRKVLDAGMTPVLCRSEALEVRKAGTHVEFMFGQVRAALVGWSAEDITKIVTACEPIWAVDMSETATSEDAQEMCGAIRKALVEDFGTETAKVTRVLHGGSVKPDSIKELMARPDIDGTLIGGASLKVESLAEVACFYARVCSE